MKKTIVPFLSALVLGTAILVGCEKEDRDEQGLIITAGMTRSSISLNQSTTAKLQFNSGYVIVREVVFDGDRAGASSVSISEEMISRIDLKTGIATPAFKMDIPAGTYTSVSLGIEIQDENDKPSVVAEGVYVNDAGVSTPIRFEFNSGEVFEAESDTQVTLLQSTPATAKITFDPHDWFATLTKTQLDNATRTNGVIIISENKNEALFDIVADRLDNATEAVFK